MSNSKTSSMAASIVVLLIMMIVMSFMMGGCQNDASYEEHIQGCIDTYGEHNAYGCIENINHKFNKASGSNQLAY